jgi:hypothetical protein
MKVRSENSAAKKDVILSIILYVLKHRSDRAVRGNVSDWEGCTLEDYLLLRHDLHFPHICLCALTGKIAKNNSSQTKLWGRAAP